MGPRFYCISKGPERRFAAGAPRNPRDPPVQSRSSVRSCTNATIDSIFSSPVKICELGFLERLECFLRVSLPQRLKATGPECLCYVTA